MTFEPPPDFHGTVSVPYRVCFVDGSCDEGLITITVGSINDAPRAGPDRVTIPEDTTATVEVLLNDYDVDEGERLTITGVAVTGISAGTATGARPARIEATIEDDTVVLTPGPNWWGRAVVEYTIADPTGLTATGVVDVDVVSVNDLPVAVDDEATGYENTPLVIDVLANDGDDDGDQLKIVSVAAANGGAATTDGSTVTFVPHPRYFGPAGFSYAITDGKVSSSATVTIDIVDITSQPLLSADTATGAEDQTILIDPLANDVGVNALLNRDSMTIVRPPANGDAIWNGAVVAYKPDLNWSGQDSFDYLVCNALEFCNVAKVVVTVDPVNDKPILTVGSDLTVAEDAGPQAQSGWATTVPGPADEAAQTLSFAVSNDNPTLFATQPSHRPHRPAHLHPGRRRQRHRHHHRHRHRRRRHHRRRHRHLRPPDRHHHHHPGQRRARPSRCRRRPTSTVSRGRRTPAESGCATAIVARSRRRVRPDAQLRGLQRQQPAVHHPTRHRSHQRRAHLHRRRRRQRHRHHHHHRHRRRRHRRRRHRHHVDHQTFTITVTPVNDDPAAIDDARSVDEDDLSASPSTC